MPDFVYSTANSPFMKKMAEHILPFECLIPSERACNKLHRLTVLDEKLKGFKFDMSKGPKPNIDLIPPPRWSHVTIPFNYS